MTTLSDLTNKDVSKALQSVFVKQGTSKDGNPYQYLEFVWKNGWKMRAFLNDDQRFGFLNAIETVRKSENTSEPSSVLDGAKEVSLADTSDLGF